MAESTNIWVKTSALEKAISGKTLKDIKRGLPTGAEDEIVDWGWVSATMKRQDQTMIEIFVQDQESPHFGATVKMPLDSFSNGDILAGNKYRDEEAYDEDDEGEMYPDDLIILTHLHEPEVVHCLRKRYAYDKIYTSTGPILLALNPFKNCKQLYNNKSMEEYWARGELMSKGVVDDQEPLPPHVYGIADRTFRYMMQSLEENKSGQGKRGTGKASTSDQSILVSGESGAGKTVTTKFIMQYLATLSQRSTSGVVSTKVGGGQTIEQQVLQSNPILESFGNARTIRNDNSSRFGKFIEIKFHKGALVGASVETYLLEKVRLLTQAEGERNYHIFYEIFCMSDEELDRFHMGIYNPEDFNMTNRSGTFDRRDGVEDFETYDDLRKAMKILGLSPEVQNDIMTIPAAAMHASNVTFTAISNDESTLDTSNPHLEPFLELMGLGFKDLEKALCYLKIKAGREFHMRTLPKEKALKGLEALIKAFYGALFTFLVRQINDSITVKDSSNNRRRVTSSSSNPEEATIGVLDIFGFESFKFNSFEQLCINYCNEALQQQFNLFVLKNEQAEYEREGIAWSFISFPDNQDVLDLIDKKGSGILNILDDQCRAPGTTDKTFCIDLYKKCTGHSRFEADYRQVGAQKFGVKHYAGPVEYDTKGFVEKNRDELPKEATDLLFGSTKGIVQDLASILSNPSVSGQGEARPRSVSPTRPSASSVKVTVGSQFSKQLRDLRAKIDLTSPHYVRCLKPNDLLLPDHFNPLIISDQLRYAGVIEAVRVSRVGYPHRYLHNAFVARYRILALSDLKKAQRMAKRLKPVDVVVKALASKIWKLKQDKEDNKQSDEPPNLIAVGLQVGKTKVFLRRSAYDTIEQLRSTKNAEATVEIQRIARGYIIRRSYTRFRRSIIALQCKVRVMSAERRVHELRLNFRSTKIQACWRRSVQRKQYLATLKIVRWIQKVQRGRIGRQKYNTLNQVRKTIVIQRYWRRFKLQKNYIKTRYAALIIQCAIRCRWARVEVRNLKLQARDLNSAVSERDALRKDNLQLREQLKKAQESLSSAVLNAALDQSIITELDEAKRSISELQEAIQTLKKDLNKAKVDAKDKESQAYDAEAAKKAAELKAEEQLSRAEKYKKRFVEDHERVKKLKEENEVQATTIKDLTQTLKSNEQSENSSNDTMNKQLEESQREIVHLRQQAIDTSIVLEQLQNENKVLKQNIKSKSNNQLQSSEDSDSKLIAARARIRDLEQQLTERQEQRVMEENFQESSQELLKYKEQTSQEIKKKNLEINSLKNELENAKNMVAEFSSNGDMILSLQQEIQRLKNELELKKTQSAGEIDPNSPMALAQRYEELRRLAEAGLQKDREIDKLKARIEELELDTYPAERSNNEEGEALRSYIDELQKEICNLREEVELLSKAEPEPSEVHSSKVAGAFERRISLLTMMLHGHPTHDNASSHGNEAHNIILPDELENRMNELEDEVEALKAVNSMLRENVEKSRRKIKELEEDLKTEKEVSRKELESFARTLRGVDELRSAAEGMSRKMNQMKSTHSRTPVRRRGSVSKGFSDEVVDDFDGQFEENFKMIEAEGKRFESEAASKVEAPKSLSFWGFDLLKGLKPPAPNDIPIEEELDKVDDDISKIMATRNKRKKKKRRGSGNSIVSSFF